MAVTIRPLCIHEELQQVSQIDQRMWPGGDAIPVSLLRVFGDHGGLILGAFDEGAMVAMAVAFPARYEETEYLHSHMMAVLPSHQSQGIGRLMKAYQVRWALAQGYGFVGWTFDPLQMRNARFNLGILKARVLAFYANYYGSLGDAINGALPTHRFFVGLNPKWQSQAMRRPRKLVPIPPDILLWRQQDPIRAAWWSDYYLAQFADCRYPVLGIARLPRGRLCYVCGD